MKKYIIIVVVFTLLTAFFTGCSKNDIKDIDDEVIETFEVIKSDEGSNGNEEDASSNVELDEKFAEIDFYLVSDVYSRNVMQEDVEVLEMFAQDRSNFVRVVSNDLDQEVYAYNYESGDFTYLYYFDSELLSKTVINVETGAIIQDDDNYATILKEDADELKDYFYSLIEISNISVAELKN